MNEKKTVGEYIRSNLLNLGIKDIVVTGVLYYSNNKALPNDLECDESRQIEGLLSYFCSLGHWKMAKQLDIEPTHALFDIQIECDGKRIGHVRCDGDFDFEAATNLKTALGWKIATDGGRTRSIEFFDLNKAATSLLDTIRVNGTKEQAFFSAYFDMLKRVFIDDYTTRCSDGYCGAATTLWRVATRELGMEHAGYEFYY